MPRPPDAALRRREALRAMLSRGEAVATTALARRFGVNGITIRRDLTDLQREGTVVRTHGGAVPAQRITFEFALEERRRRRLDEKRRIGAAAARRVREGQTLFLDTGTTTFELARALVAAAPPCRVATSSLVIASILWGRPGIELHLLGGRVRDGSPDLVGSGTELMLDRLAADLAFVGSEGLDPARGNFAEHVDAARVTERMAANARRVVVVADQSKLGKTGPARCLAIAEIDELITDRGADRRIVAALRARGVKVSAV
jgi:DeoR/GlpR family transcriptional regulator of sugar metabolism